MRQSGGRTLVNGFAVDQAECAGFAAEVDIGGYGEIVAEVELLVDQGNAQLRRPTWGVYGGGRIIDQDFAVVGCLDAGEVLHQRRLAGAVLTDDGQNLTGFDRHIDRVEGENPGEAFCYAVDLQ